MGGRHLRFIAGPQTGAYIALPEAGEASMGRTPEAQIQVAEEMVSRRHARIVADGGSIQLEDLGSTNGTFINGRKIAPRELLALQLDDRILIGSSVMQLIDDAGLAEPISRPTIAAPPQRLDAAMCGQLAEVPLADVLQLLARGRKHGSLTLGRPPIAKLELQAGSVVGICHLQHPHWTATKTLCRLMARREGAFDFTPRSPATQGATPAAQSAPVLGGSLEAALLEASRCLDELAAKRAEWPEGSEALGLRAPLVPSLSDLTGRELDILQAALAAPSVEAVLDHEPNSDLPVVVTLSQLHNAGYLWPRPIGPPTSFGPPPTVEAADPPIGKVSPPAETA